MNLALKIDVHTYRGTREGVPALTELLKRYEAGATFLFTLGPDHTGRAIRHIFRPGVVRKAQRASLLSHYGLLTLMYGTLLPGPDIGRRCAETLRAVRDAGFEVGIHAWDHVKWRNGVAGGDAAWTRSQMELAIRRFREIFETEPRVHGAAGWQMNRHAYRLTQMLGFGYCSDTRGAQPFVPIYQAEIVACPQLPTTLPTMDELIGTDGINVNSIAGRLLKLTRDPPATGHVFTLRAELEGMKLRPVFEQLLQGWREQGYRLVCLGDYFEGLPDKNLPRHEVSTGTLPGRSRPLALQGAEFLA